MGWELPRGKSFDTSRTYLMGVINLTPDSFSDGGLFGKGRYPDPQSALERARTLVREGADVLDLGAESTRPGALPVSADEECARLLPALAAIRQELDIPVSIDTYKAPVARAALAAGADIINDISGLRFDADLARTIAEFDAACVLMHIKGTPRDMQQNPRYRDLWGEITSFLEAGLDRARAAGITAERIAVDPGIGFGKSLEDNFRIIRELAALKRLGRPILIGPSRKSFIGLTLDLPVGERLEGSLAAALLAIAHGARIVRVHDVRSMKRAAVIADAILKCE